MAYNEARKRATIEYKKKNVHRIPLDMKNELYDIVKEAASNAGQTVAGYVKKATFDRMRSEGFLPDQDSNEQK